MLGRLGGTVIAVCTHPAARFSDKNAFFRTLRRELATASADEGRRAA